MKTGAVSLLLADARETLTNRVKKLAEEAPLEAALAAWLIPDWTTGQAPSQTMQESVTRLATSRDYRDAATAGFAAACLTRTGATLSSFEIDSFSEELEWIAGRPYQLSNGNFAGFFSDAPALLGLALGAIYAGNDNAKTKIKEWLQSLLAACSQRRGIEDWELCLLASTCYMCGLGASVPFHKTSKAAPAIIALRRCKALPILAGEDESDAEESVLKQLVSPTLYDVVGTQATFLLAAHDWVRRAATIAVPSRATVADVTGVLRGIQASFHRWTWEEKRKTPLSQARKWHIESEYHVQNLLWIILRPMFPDLEDEFYTEPMGQKRPRADIGIPSLRLIIEAKFMRASASPQDMIGEIAEDTGLYLTPQFPYDTIIPFIWDNVPRPQEHDVMRQGMMKMVGIADVVIISRPNTMTLDATPTPEKPATPPVDNVTKNIP